MIVTKRLACVTENIHDICVFFHTNLISWVCTETQVNKRHIFCRFPQRHTAGNLLFFHCKFEFNFVKGSSDNVSVFREDHKDKVGGPRKAIPSEILPQHFFHRDLNLVIFHQKAVESLNFEKRFVHCLIEVSKLDFLNLECF